jgi:hypothetical protein
MAFSILEQFPPRAIRGFSAALYPMVPQLAAIAGFRRESAL